MRVASIMETEKIAEFKCGERCHVGNVFGETLECGPCQEQCTRLDTDGYPKTARKRLRKADGGLYEDIDTGHKFKSKRVEDDKMRLVPVFDGNIKWKTGAGFDAIQLIISCLVDAFVLWDKDVNGPMTRVVWRQRCQGVDWMPSIKCMTHGEVVETSSVNNLRNGQTVGCTQCVPQLKIWRSRYEEFISSILPVGTQLLTTHKEWEDQCTGREWCPRIKCVKHGTIVDRTSINALQQGNNIGCKLCITNLNHWRHRYSEFCLFVPQGFELLTSEDEWIVSCNGSSFCPTIRCVIHDILVNTTSISNLCAGHSVGCRKCVPQLDSWKNRRTEFCEQILPSGYELLTTTEDWYEKCTGCNWCPVIRCIKHDIVVDMTSITSLQQGGGIPCPKCVPGNWKHRYSEFCSIVPRGFELLTPEDEWMVFCTGATYCPTFRCIAHGTIIDSTCIASLQQGGGVGCPKCRNKTEAVLSEWLVKTFPAATITHGTFRGPGTTHFDIHAHFPDGPSDGPPGGFAVLIELDGAQHFWEDCYHFSLEGCQRDLAKEEWAKTKKLSVIRVLQEDVWNDRNGWRRWIRSCIDKARSSEPSVYIPDAPEYTSEKSVYVQLRQPKTSTGAGPSSTAPKKPGTLMDKWLGK